MLPFEVSITEVAPLPTYQRIAAEALQLTRLGLSFEKIAETLAVNDKTVAKAVKWLKQ